MNGNLRSAVISIFLIAFIIIWSFQFTTGAQGVPVNLGVEPTWRAEPYTNYTLSGIIQTDFLRTSSSNYTVTKSAAAGYTLGDDGFTANFSGASNYVRLVNTTLHPYSFKAVVSFEPALTTLPYLYIKWTPPSGYQYITQNVYFYEDKIYLITNTGYGGTVDTSVLRYPVNATRTFAIAGSITADGLVKFYMNGLLMSYQTNVTFTGTQYHSIDLTSGAVWTNTSRLIKLHMLELASSSTVTVSDSLHGSITPWGYDATLAFQFHADAMRPESLGLLYNLSEAYGFVGDLDIFVDSTTTVPGLQDADFLAQILNLQDLGWYIGVHTFSPVDTTNRTESLTLADEFVSLLGHNPESWSDHGSMNTNLWINGDNVSSEYYLGDYIRETIGIAWADSSGLDHNTLNMDLEGVYSGLEEYPELDLFNAYVGLLVADGYGAYYPIAKIDDRIVTPIVTERGVRAYHDYLRYWYYVSNRSTGANYTYYFSTEDGYTHAVDVGSQYQKTVYNYAYWDFIVRPKVEQFIHDLTNHDLWNPSLKNLVARSKQVQETTVTDGLTSVTISNNGTAISGYTLWTKTEPNYALYDSATGNYYYARSNNYSHSFAIESVPANGDLVLQKVTSTGPTFTGTPGQVWADSLATYFYALDTGSASVPSNYIIERVYDLTSDTGVPWSVIDGDLTFSITQDHIYEIIWYSETISSLIDLSFIMLTFGVMVAVVTSAIAPLKDPKTRTTQKMVRTTIRTVIFTVISMVLLVAVHAIIYSG